MRLLLAEDEHDLSGAIAAVLKHHNFTVDVVDNGLDAIDYLRTEVYDGAVLDVMMPGKDGFQVLETIRREGNSVPVLMLTARSELDDRLHGLDSGADDYLTKPFEMAELIARVRAITRRRADIASSELSFGDLTLDRMTYILTCAAVEADGKKKETSLSNKEYQMLEMLMENPGRILSADQFMDKIWGYDSEAELNVVWVYISNLRKKLTSVGSTVSIKATRGVGYSLVKP